MPPAIRRTGNHHKIDVQDSTLTHPGIPLQTQPGTYFGPSGTTTLPWSGSSPGASCVWPNSTNRGGPTIDGTLGIA